MIDEGQLSAEVVRAREVRRLAGLPVSLAAGDSIGLLARVLQTGIERVVQEQGETAARTAPAA